MTEEDAYWLRVAREIGSRSDCTRRKVGAVLVHKGQIIGHGFNYNQDPRPTSIINLARCEAGGCPRGRMSFEDLPAGAPYEGNCEAIHAEISAFRSYFQGDPIPTGIRSNWLSIPHPGIRIYVSSTPCQNCYEAITRSGAYLVHAP